MIMPMPNSILTVQAIIFYAYTAFTLFIYILFISQYQIIPAIVTIYIAVFFMLGELGVFPFKGKNIIFYKKSFYFHLLLLIALTANLNGMQAPTWYPTDNTQWIFTVWLLYGVLTQARGIKAGG